MALYRPVQKKEKEGFSGWSISTKEISSKRGRIHRFRKNLFSRLSLFFQMVIYRCELFQEIKWHEQQEAGTAFGPCPGRLSDGSPWHTGKLQVAYTAVLHVETSAFRVSAVCTVCRLWQNHNLGCEEDPACPMAVGFPFRQAEIFPLRLDGTSVRPTGTGGLLRSR